ncbi:myo-inositol 2-dehydrogenase [Jannaschia pagri]|uniref:Myo-inositol 2-dehydrogenase n=1 Tax=Jannaschia pagri TaxID=2829797 RepID=A0ABQ4NLS1_9RHOB|nr:MULTISPECIES: Gfo/Idh/MocA family oxidoreductase [unclassified Jannaschia]GIT91523.1 myo-inositol 2-dehydrogenase [Jannaschia sp. AI_61]GIT95357.1 myo-inositol 2-dehydrogenase [Jannaschia sp. AI_62]
MTDIGIGIVGGGYMGKAHAVAYAAVGAVFETTLRPRLEMVCATSEASADRYRAAFGFARATSDWQALVADPKVDAVIIASPQSTHRAIAEAAFALGKPVFCEKPLGRDVADSQAMVAAAEASGAVNMTGFNYVRTPATQEAIRLVREGAIGDITWYRGEHTEDFLADPDAPATWRCQGRETGTMGDLSPHPINCALALMGPITSLNAVVETVHKTRPGPDGPVQVTNDDHAQMMVRFASGVMGHIYASRTATGKKMGYAYEIHGTRGSIRFDGEDQNSLHVYRAEGPEAGRGFTRVLTGPAHPNYAAFCQGPGHGTGYQDQIIIEARDFLAAIEAGQSAFPTFRDGMEVNRVVDAAWTSSETRAWVDL